MKFLRTMRDKFAKKGLLKIFGVVIVVIVLFVAATMVFNYVTRPRIQYSLKENNCTGDAIGARNKTIGADLKSCVLILSAKNLQNKSAYIDYDGVIGGEDPLIRIYSGTGKFCYALLAGEGASFSPSATNNLTLRCGRVQKPPTDYDETSDVNPTSIVIGGYLKTTLKVDATR